MSGSRGQPLDLFAAMKCHWAWRLELRLLVLEKGSSLRPEDAARGDACDLGQWLAGPAEAYRALPTLEPLRAAHQAFHAAAGAVVERLRVQGREAALELLRPDGALDRASNDVAIAIFKLMRDAEAL